VRALESLVAGRGAREQPRLERLATVRADHLVDALAVGKLGHPASITGPVDPATTLFEMSPQRRIALVSVLAAVVLISVKLAAGLVTGSLGLLSEAAHSGTDLAAALLTFFAVGVAVRPADRAHPYGHGKAEHLAALAEAAVLVGISLLVGVTAARRLADEAPPDVSVTWWAIAVLVAVIAIDASRTVVSLRAARRFESAAFATNALHFASDLGGSAAVLVGLLAVRAGYADADSIAALFVAVLILGGATHLARQNVDVLMDRMPAGAHEAVRRALEKLEPDVELRRLRMRRAAGRHFADVVIGVPPAAAVEQGHAAASAVEDAVESAVPGTDVVVHVEPQPVHAALRERAHAAALRVPRVREIHNVGVLEIGERTEISLHLKLPGSLSLDEAHEVASEVEAAILEALPDVDAVQTHLEPLSEERRVTAILPDAIEAEADGVRAIVREVTDGDPRELRFLHTELGLVAFLTLAMEPDRTLSEAHARASEVEERIRRDHPQIADVIVHTEP
jgi:cation diffusion facilitator family transporter